MLTDWKFISSQINKSNSIQKQQSQERQGEIPGTNFQVIFSIYNQMAEEFMQFLKYLISLQEFLAR